MAGQKAVEIDVYEATAEMTEIGAGIVIWPRTWEILKKLGLEETLTKLLPSPPTKEPSKSKLPLIMRSIYANGLMQAPSLDSVRVTRRMGLPCTIWL